MLRIVAFDLSLTSTGVCKSQAPAEPFALETAPLRGMQRLYWIQSRVLAHAEDADLVVLEGYSYGSGYQAHQLGELGGVVRLGLWCRGIPYVDLPPAIRCKMATGKGNASKEHVLSEAVQRLGYTGHSDDESDAMWLLEAARQHYGLSDVKLPKAHFGRTKSSKDFRWPEFDELEGAA